MRDLFSYLDSVAEIRTVPGGARLCERGRQAEAAYMIRAGKVKIFQTESGHDIVIAMLGPGAIFGEMALIRFDSYTLNAETVGETSVYVITPDLLHRKLKETDPLIRTILNAAMDRIYEANQLLVDIEKSRTIP